MSTKIILTISFFLHCLTGYSQTKKNYFNLTLVNNSKYTTACTILGNDKTDSVLANQTKTIRFDLPPEQISFYLNLWTNNSSPTSYKNKLIRILNTQKSKQISISRDNQLKYLLTPSEKIIADYNPQVRTKNFWKLDDIIKANFNDISSAEIIYLSLCDIDVKTDTIRKYFNFLANRIASTAYGKRISDYLTARSRLTIGAKVDDFSLPDTTGKLVNLYEIQSDYILLDFWFSRCGPCIKSFPDLQNLYSKTERTKFKIIGISVDKVNESSLWKNTIIKHNLEWLNLNDSKSFLTNKMAIVNYPTKILIDKNKNIILVDSDNSYENFYNEIGKLINNK